MNLHKSPNAVTAAEALYLNLQAKGLDVLLNDRDERPDVNLSGIELMGIPHRIVIGEKFFKQGLMNTKAVVTVMRNN